MSVYLLRVGADTTKSGGQTRSPMLEDHEYYFLPIPVFSTREKGAGLTYANYEWHGRQVLEYLPPERKETLASLFVHLDPEFIGYTYGSPLRNRKGWREKNYAKLCALKAGDLLVFYAYFEGPAQTPHEPNPLDGLYLFAYLTVRKALVLHKRVDDSNPQRRYALQPEDHDLVGRNHHYLACWDDSVVVIGDPKTSRVFKRAVLLSSYQHDHVKSNYIPCQRVREILQYNKSLNLSSLRSEFPLGSCTRLRRYLDAESGGSIQSPQVHSDPLP